MGYSTDFSGVIKLEPALTATQVKTMVAFADERHDGPVGPGIWCDFEPTIDGTGLKWNGNEKTYDGAEWIQYLVTEFLARWGVTANGELIATGESPGDIWMIRVIDNQVERVVATISFG